MITAGSLRKIDQHDTAEISPALFSAFTVTMVGDIAFVKRAKLKLRLVYTGKEQVKEKINNSAFLLLVVG